MPVIFSHHMWVRKINISLTHTNTPSPLRFYSQKHAMITGGNILETKSGITDKVLSWYDPSYLIGQLAAFVQNVNWTPLQKNKRSDNVPYKSDHLLCCQMLRYRDQCLHCPLFQDDGQNGFGTSLTQLVSAIPCQQTELMFMWTRITYQHRICQQTV